MSKTFQTTLMNKWMLGCILCASFIVTGCNKKTPPAPQAPAVTVAKPLSQDVRNYEVFDGNVAPLLTVNLEARVPGYLTKILFEDGAYVKKDQLLFIIEQDQYLQQVKLNQAIYDEAKIEVTRQKALVKDNATSQAAVDKATSSFLQAEANLKLAKINYGYTEIRAPFDGLMGRHLIDVGNYLGSTATGVKLATIQKIDPIYVYFSINERDLLKYQNKYVTEKNRKSLVNKLPVYIQLQGETGYAHEGTLDFAANLLNTSTGSLQLRAEVPNSKLDLVPGLYAKVMAYYGAERKALLIPYTSVQTDQQGAYIFVMDDNKKIQRRNITLGQRFAPLVEVTQGLTDADTVVINGFINVRAGQTANPSSTTIDPLPKR
jgi:multidrug efflux system membrane fusion protein